MRLLRAVAIFALWFLAISATVGAVPMLTQPQGEPWQMPQSLLAHSPFHSFLVPGLLLLVSNGLVSVYVLFLAFRRTRGYALWIAAQGCILLGWLIVECILIRLVIWPHYMYGAVALVLIASGLGLNRASGREFRAVA